MLGVAGVFGGSLFSAMHGSLVTSSLIRDTTENESANEGYRFGPKPRRTKNLSFENSPFANHSSEAQSSSSSSPASSISSRLFAFT
jgi:hypothetical protein